jgi:hypothetical protein
MAKSAIQKAAPETADLEKTDAEAAGAATRLFIELPGVFAGPRLLAGPCGLPWPPQTPILTQSLLAEILIQR